MSEFRILLALLHFFFYFIQFHNDICKTQLIKHVAINIQQKDIYHIWNIQNLASNYCFGIFKLFYETQTKQKKYYIFFY